jgi:hypothetical protein
MHITHFSSLRGRRDIGVVRPIVTEKASMTNFARRAVIQSSGASDYYQCTDEHGRKDVAENPIRFAQL